VTLERTTVPPITLKIDLTLFFFKLEKGVCVCVVGGVINKDVMPSLVVNILYVY